MAEKRANARTKAKRTDGCVEEKQTYERPVEKQTDECGKEKQTDEGLEETQTSGRPEEFLERFLADGDAYAAWLAAGFPEEGAHAGIGRALTAPGVSAIIGRRLRTGDAGGIADADEILRYLTELLRGDAAERERLKAAELLGKRYGLFSERLSEDAAPVTVVDDLHG